MVTYIYEPKLRQKQHQAKQNWVKNFEENWVKKFEENWVKKFEENLVQKKSGPKVNWFKKFRSKQITGSKVR